MNGNGTIKVTWLYLTPPAAPSGLQLLRVPQHRLNQARLLCCRLEPGTRKRTTCCTIGRYLGAFAVSRGCLGASSIVEPGLRTTIAAKPMAVIGSHLRPLMLQKETLSRVAPCSWNQPLLASVLHPSSARWSNHLPTSP